MPELADRVPRALTREDVEWADLVVTMGCGDACPVVAGKEYVDWELDDPAGKGLDEVRRIRDEIAQRVAHL
jgi:arsenate reductase